MLEVIKTSDTKNNYLDLKITIQEIDLVYNADINYQLSDENILRVFTPGKYQITCSYHDNEETFDLYVTNVYW